MSEGGQFEPIAGVDLETFTRGGHGLTTRGVTEEGPVLTHVAEQASTHPMEDRRRRVERAHRQRPRGAAAQRLRCTSR